MRRQRPRRRRGGGGGQGRGGGDRGDFYGGGRDGLGGARNRHHHPSAHHGMPSATVGDSGYGYTMPAPQPRQVGPPEGFRILNSQPGRGGGRGGHPGRGGGRGGGHPQGGGMLPIRNHLQQADHYRVAPNVASATPVRGGFAPKILRKASGAGGLGGPGGEHASAVGNGVGPPPGLAPKGLLSRGSGPQHHDIQFPAPRQGHQNGPAAATATAGGNVVPVSIAVPPRLMQQPHAILKPRAGEAPSTPTLVARQPPKLQVRPSARVSAPVPERAASSAPTPTAVTGGGGGASTARATSVVLLDRFLRIRRHEEIEKRLQDQPDFTVIGIVGLQGVGKSTILSRFAASEVSLGGKVFPAQSMSTILNATNSTQGIDAYVTKTRTILLDAQPSLSPGILMDLYRREDVLGPSTKTHQNLLEIQSIQVLLLLLSICHVLIVPSDFLPDMQMWKLLKTVLMLRKNTPLGDPFLSNVRDMSSGVPTIPDIVFVHNKVPPADFNLSRFEMFRNVVHSFFRSAKFRDQKDVVGNSQFAPFARHLDNSATALNVNVNFFCLPLYSDDKGKEEFEQCLDELVGQVCAMPKLKMVSRFTEKSWLKNAFLVWGEINHCQALMEYNQILQRLGVYG